MFNERSLLEIFTDTLIDGGCTVNKPSVAKLVDLVIRREADLLHGLELRASRHSRQIMESLNDEQRRAGNTPLETLPNGDGSGVEKEPVS